MNEAERSSAEAPAAPDLVAALFASLDAPARAALEGARDLARREGLALYLVGGAVRDLLLGRPAPDLDLMVAGDDLAFTRRLGRRLNAAVELHPAFLTATLRGPGFRLDLALPRRERYERPGALPRVEPARLEEDLARRDFTVNAMALAVTPAENRVLDPHGGRIDLARRRLRVLHPASFRDDASRIVRGLVFEERLGFRFDPDTQELARRSIVGGDLARLGQDRLAAALQPLLRLALDSPRVAKRMAALGLPAAVHPALRLTVEERGRLRRFAAARRRLAALSDPPVATPPAALTTLAWIWDLAAPECAGASAALGAGGEGDPVAAGVSPTEMRTLTARLDRRGLAPHAAAALLRGRTGVELVALTAEGSPAAAAWVERELGTFRSLRLELRGGDLVELGFAPGPEIGAALAATRDARLDGRIAAGEERDFAVGWLRDRVGEPVG